MTNARSATVLILGYVLAVCVVAGSSPAMAEEPSLIELPPAQGLFDPATVPTCPEEQLGCNPEGPDPICWTYTCDCRPPICPRCPAVYEKIRHLEDWRACLSVRPSARGDWSDMAKAIDLGTSWFQADFGGSARARWEGWQNQIFSPADAGDDNWVLGRARLHADLHFGNLLRVFVGGLYADQWTRELGPRYGDVDQGALLNGFIEIGHKWGRGWDAGVGVGRRQMAYGGERLVSPYDWLNSPQTFDGVHGWIGRNHNRVSVFVVRPVVVRPYETNERDDDVGFWGIHLVNETMTCLSIDAYFMGFHETDATYAFRTGNEDRYTFGMRFAGVITETRFDYDFEGAYQFGDFDGDAIRAWFLAFELGWKPPSRRFAPRFAFGVDYASGDGGEDDGTLGTFNPLYGNGHEYLGFADIVGRSNLAAVHVTFSLSPAKRLELRADVHGFWRANDGDAVYSPFGRALIPAVPGIDDKYIATELDLSAKWRLDRHWLFSGGWSHVWPGALPTEHGNEEPIDFVWIEVEFVF